jgi:hypothetical protein
MTSKFNRVQRGSAIGVVRWAALILAISVFLAPPAMAQAPAKAQTKAAPAATIRLPGHRLPDAVLAKAELIRRLAPVEGPADDEQLTLTIILKRDDEAGFQRFLQAVQDPHSTYYQHFLSPTQLAERYGPTLSSYRQVENWLTQRGFDIAEQSPNRMTLTVRGRRGAAERAFGIQINDYRLGDAQLYANDQDPALPSVLAQHVAAITGLANLAQPVPSLQSNPSLCAAATALLVGSVFFPAALPPAIFTAFVCIEVFFSQGIDYGPGGPPFLRASSNGPIRATPPLLNVGGGAGQTIGLLEFDSADHRDVENFVDFVRGGGLPIGSAANVSEVPVNGGAPRGPNQDEVLLDINAALLLAPEARVVVYSAPFAGAGTSFQALFNAMINGGVTVISNSWAYCEDQTTLADVQSIDTILQTAAAAGISVFNASGDTGSTCLDGSRNTAAVPASSPSATAVGGTSRVVGSGFTITRERWWDGSADMPTTGQGGFGVSRYFSRPAYQNGFTAEAMRSIPDVAIGADPAGGIPICQASAGGCPTGLLYGGTSLAAPTWAALAARMNEAAGRNLGAFNPRLYPVAGSGGFHGPAALASDFAHVGLGTPNVAALTAALTGRAVGTTSPSRSTALAYSGFDPNATAAATVAADGSAEGAVVVRLRDDSGAPVSGHIVQVAALGSTQATLAVNRVTTDADGAAVFTVTDTAVETATYSVTDSSVGVTLLAQPSLSFVVPPATSASIAALTNTAPSDGITATPITVTLRDARAQPTPGKRVTLAQNAGHSVIRGPTSGVTAADGTIVFNVVDAVAESVTYTAVDISDGSLPVPGSVAITFGGASGGSCVGPAPTVISGYALSSFYNGFFAQNFFFGNVNWGGCPGATNPAFDSAGNAYIANFRTGDLYRLPPGERSISDANRIANLGQTLGQPTFGPDGALYLTRSATTGDFRTGDLIQVDPQTGANLRTLASNLTCPGGLSVDPLSGDLFFDDLCTGAGSDDPSIFRVRNPSGGAPVVSVYTTLPATPNGALAFTPDGALYAVTGYFNNPVAPVVRISGTNGPATPVQTTLNGVTTAFGLAVGAVDAGGAARSLLVVPNGNLTLVDLTATPVTATQLGTGLSAGINGPDGCQYAAVSDTVYRLTPSSGVCTFSPVNPSPQLALSADSPNGEAVQGAPQTVTAVLRNLPAVAGVPVMFVVSGANGGRSQLVMTDSAGRASWTYAAAVTGTDTIIASAPNSTETLVSNAVRLLWASGRHVTHLSQNLSPLSGTPGQTIMLSAVLADISARPATPIAGQTVQLSLSGTACSAATDTAGSVRCAVTIPTALGTRQLQAHYDGSAQYTPADSSTGFNALAPAASPAPAPTPAPAPGSSGRGGALDESVLFGLFMMLLMRRGITQRRIRRGQRA